MMLVDFDIAVAGPWEEMHMSGGVGNVVVAHLWVRGEGSRNVSSCSMIPVQAWRCHWFQPHGRLVPLYKV
jgi:hypothetical protein